MFSLWSYLIYFSLNSIIFISTTPLSANFWMFFFLLPCQKKRYKVHNLVVFSCYWQRLTFHFDSCIFNDVWVGMGPVDPARSCCHKRDYFGQHSRFSFPLCSEKKNRRTAVFRAERSAKEAAVSAKDSAASDAEPFAVAGTVPHIRPMPRPERRGWRSIFFFQSNCKEVQTIYYQTLCA